MTCSPCREAFIVNLVLFDVFHNLERSQTFLKEAGRVLTSDGRILLMEPLIRAMTSPSYGLLHHEPINYREKTSSNDEPPQIETDNAA